MYQKVLIKISKESLAFWIKTSNGNVIPIGDNIPLCFHVSDKKLFIGTDAINKAGKNNPNLINNYFDLLKQNNSVDFKIYGNKYSIHELFSLGIIEYVDKHFYENRIRDISIEEYKKEICLYLWLEDDLSDNDKTFIIDRLNNCGFKSVMKVNIESHLSSIINANFSNKNTPKILINVLSDDLYIKLFSSDESKYISNIVKIKDGAINPLYQIYANQILNFISETNHGLLLDREKERKFIRSQCSKLILSKEPLIIGNVELSDGRLAYYWVFKSEIEKAKSYDRNVEDIVLKPLKNLLDQFNYSSAVRPILLISSAKEFEEYIYEKSKSEFNPNILDEKFYEKLTESIFNNMDLDERLSNSISNGVESKPKVSPAPIPGGVESKSKISPAPISGGVESKPKVSPVPIPGGVESKPKVSSAPIPGGVESKSKISPAPISGGVESKSKISPAPISGGVESKPKVSPVPIPGGVESKPKVSSAPIPGGVESKPKVSSAPIPGGVESKPKVSSAPIPGGVESKPKVSSAPIPGGVESKPKVSSAPIPGGVESKPKVSSAPIPGGGESRKEERNYPPIPPPLPKK